MKIKAFFSNYYPAVLILLTLVAFSLFAYREADVSVSTRRTKLFELRVKEAATAVSERIQTHIQILKGCQGLFYASERVTAKDWKEYIGSLDMTTHYPGFEAIAFAKYIKKDEVPVLERQIKDSGFGRFRVRSSFENDHLTPIIFIEPFNGRNLRAFGFDMYSEANRRRAMDSARITGKPVFTRRVVLVQEGSSDVQPGFLLYLPVYRNPDQTKTIEDRQRNIEGFVYNAFRSYDLMKAVFQDFTDMHIDVYDGEVGKDNLLYTEDSRVSATNESNVIEFTADTTIATAGTKWKMVLTTNENFGSNIERRQPTLILIFGLALSFLIFIIAIEIIRRKSEVLKELTLAKQLEHKKDEFIGIASHELKTPLTSIKAYTQLLERSQLNEKERSLVQKTNVQIGKLNLLINDLLDVSKIQAGKLQLNISSFSLKEFINDSVEMVQQMYKTHRIIKPESIPDVMLTGDKFRLEQALTNFLINAVKYSPGEEYVYVDLKLSGKFILIEVKDKGIGISEESRNRIFEKFYRSESVSPTISGLGMGLYISNEILKRHGATVNVSSTLGKGSTFQIQLPIKDNVDTLTKIEYYKENN